MIPRLKDIKARFVFFRNFPRKALFKRGEIVSLRRLDHVSEKDQSEAHKKFGAGTKGKIAAMWYNPNNYQRPSRYYLWINRRLYRVSSSHLTNRRVTAIRRRSLGRAVVREQ